MLADYHVHTEYSDDSVYPIEAVVKDAIGLGLDEICITDHFIKLLISKKPAPSKRFHRLQLGG